MHVNELVLHGAEYTSTAGYSHSCSFTIKLKFSGGLHGGAIYVYYSCMLLQCSPLESNPLDKTSFQIIPYIELIHKLNCMHGITVSIENLQLASAYKSA